MEAEVQTNTPATVTNALRCSCGGPVWHAKEALAAAFYTVLSNVARSAMAPTWAALSHTFMRS